MRGALAVLWLAVALVSCGDRSNPLSPTSLESFTPSYPWAFYMVVLDNETFYFDAPLMVRDGCVYVMRPGHEFKLGCGSVVVTYLGERT